MLSMRVKFLIFNYIQIKIKIGLGLSLELGVLVSLNPNLVNYTPTLSHIEPKNPWISRVNSKKISILTLPFSCILYCIYCIFLHKKFYLFYWQILINSSYDSVVLLLLCYTDAPPLLIGYIVFYKNQLTQKWASWFWRKNAHTWASQWFLMHSGDSYRNDSNEKNGAFPSLQVAQRVSQNYAKLEVLVCLWASIFITFAKFNFSSNLPQICMLE